MCLPNLSEAVLLILVSCRGVLAQVVSKRVSQQWRCTSLAVCASLCGITCQQRRFAGCNCQRLVGWGMFLAQRHPNTNASVMLAWVSGCWQQALLFNSAALEQPFVLEWAIQCPEGMALLQCQKHLIGKRSLSKWKQEMGNQDHIPTTCVWQRNSL